MLGDIQPYVGSNGFGLRGTPKAYAVAASATLINAGEPVAKALGNASGNVVTPAADATPVVGTDFFAGIAATTSTNTASAAGVVTVTPIDSDDIWLCAPKLSTSIDTQSKYDALVGARVLLDLTSSVYTVDLGAGDGATGGVVVEPLDITLHPNKVAFKFRNAVNYAS